jgi:hypothetical protein
MSGEDFIQRLLRTRDDYEANRQWHKFLLDGYAGTGGFEGKIKMPAASYWGAGADAYANRNLSGFYGSSEELQIDSYLDRFNREDIQKYKARAAMANYPNPVAPVVQIWMSYLSRKPMDRQGIEILSEGDQPWMQNAFGKGKTWDDLLSTVVFLRAQVLGWCPVLFDVPPSDDDTPISVAQANALGLMPRAIPLFPANLYDWHVSEEGELEWAKIVTCYHERESALDDPMEVRRVSIWYRDHVDIYEIIKVEGKDVLRSQDSRAHKWGVVPIVVCRHQPCPTDPITGVSLVGDICKQAKRLFNYLSELDEHIRASVFAMLQVPTEDEKGLSVIVGGNGSALPIKPDSRTEYKFISPTGDCAETLEKRILETLKQCARIGRTEFVNASATEGGGQAQSGVARSFQFETTNRAIATCAKHFASFDQESLRLVARMMGASEEVIDGIRVTAPTQFDVEEMSKEIEEALQANKLDLGPTAIALMTKRLVRKLLPNVDEALLAKMDSEIDDAALQKQQDSQMQRELLMSGGVDKQQQEIDAQDVEDPQQLDAAA